MAATPPPGWSRALWRTSSHSANGGNCVQVAANLPGIIAVRDSHDRHSPVLVFSRADWAAFTRTMQTSQTGTR